MSSMEAAVRDASGKPNKKWLVIRWMMLRPRRGAPSLWGWVVGNLDSSAFYSALAQSLSSSITCFWEFGALAFRCKVQVVEREGDVDSETQQDRAQQRLDAVVDAKDKFRVAEKYRPYFPLAFLLHGLSSLPSKPMIAPSSSVGQCSPSTAPQPSSLALAQRLIEKKGLRRHDVYSPLSARPSLLTDMQFTCTVQLTFYGDATFGTAGHYTTRTLEGVSLTHTVSSAGILSLSWS
ncbi:hypothetical protein EV421DRAFT_1746617 [Armillaria borealis]|uniref:Uncharacterized protein n=1 Tax=Armillaria borealis TaxID=47425 RepID=A0AA39M4U5_9AGAR|nr:hypothetical protein EV421DRAFT_1746617 [Armillaria borealis]